MGLYAFRRELGIRRDESDAAFIGLARIGVGRDGRFLILTHLADVGFVDVGAQPDVIEVGERHHRRAGHHDLAKLRLADLNDAGERRAQHRVAEHDLRQLERFLAVRILALASSTCRSAAFFSA